MLPKCKRADDRAMLLPCFSRDPVDAGAKVKTCIVNSNSELYTITDDSLPSHMRSLIPSHEQHVHDLLTLERTRRRLRYLIITLSILLALTVVVAVVLVFSLKIQSSGRLEGLYRGVTSQAASGGIPTQVDISLLGQGHQEKSRWTEVYRQTGPDTRRTPCLNECWSYAAFRFHATCEDGYCRCHGDSYDAETCLPKYNGCQIERAPANSVVVKLFGRNQTAYSCRLPLRNSSNVYVISIFGNHKARSTHVTVTGQPGDSDILVLVGYHQVHWTVQLPPGAHFKKVFVISKKRTFKQSSQAVIAFPETEDAPEVTHRLSQTGYGEDQNGGHTPELLQYIESEVGPVTSFLGASHADEVELNIGGKTLSVLSTESAVDAQ